MALRIFRYSLLITAAACGPTYSPDMPLGDRSVSVAIDCLEPQRTWAGDMVRYFGWTVSGSGEVTVVCSESRDGSAGEYLPGSNLVYVDPTKTQGQLAVRNVVGHELIHWRLYHGPHPEYAGYHVCDWGFNEPVPPMCYPLMSDRVALMAPTIGDPPVDYLAGVDRAFVAWALAP